MKKHFAGIFIFLIGLSGAASRYVWYTFTDFELRGMRKITINDTDGALRDFKLAIKKNPSAPFAAVGIATCELMKENIDKAEHEISIAMPLAKKSGIPEAIALAHIGKAMIVAVRGNKDEARRECSEAVKWAPCDTTLSIEAELCKHRINLMRD